MLLLYNITFILITISFLSVIPRLLQVVTQPSMDILQYKISSFFRTWSIVILYISIVIFVSYAFRMYQLPRYMDLKEVIIAKQSL